MKRIYAVSMVKNEQDIIESFVRHTLTFADKLLICDHLSSDKTPAILAKLIDEGLPVTVVSETNPAHIQSEVVTKLCRQAVAEGADFVLPLDADEFLLFDCVEQSLRDYLQTLPIDEIYHVSWRIYAPIDANEEIFLLYRPMRRAKTFDNGGKMIVGRNAWQIGDRIAEGNHNLLRSAADGSFKKMPQVNLEHITLAHVYWRSPEQYAAKIAVGWMNIVARYSKFAFSGGSYGDKHEALLGGESMTLEKFMPDGELFDLRPFVATGIELKYAANLKPNPLFNLMAATVPMAERCLEEQILSRRILVTTVLIDNGDETLLAQSAASVEAQDYPWQEFFVCPIVPAASAVLGNNFMRLTGENPFAELSQRRRGKYLQVILPGERVSPRKLREMVACIETQEMRFTLISGQTDDMISTKKTLFACRPPGAWMNILREGRVPGALTNILINCEIINDFAWLKECFLDGEPLLLTIWQRLLRPADDGAAVGFLPENYGQSVPNTAVSLIYRQLEWALLLNDDWQLPEEVQKAAWENFWRQDKKILRNQEIQRQNLLGAYRKNLRGLQLVPPAGAVTDIIIVSYNTLDLLKLCVASIREHTEPGTYEIIVVDNSSGDGSAEWAANEPDIIAVCNAENYGFPKACNQGMELADGQDILLLNSDCVVTYHWLTNLKRALYSAPTVGAVGCVSNCVANFQQIDTPYAAGDLATMQKFAAEYNFKSDSTKWVSWQTLIGFCFLFKREIYDKIGGLDEIFGLGNYEDDDYSLRIRQAGYDLLLCKDTFVHHFGGSSFYRSEDEEDKRIKAEKYRLLMERNREIFDRKWGVDPDRRVRHGVMDLIPQVRTETAKKFLLVSASGVDAYIVKANYPDTDFVALTPSEVEARLAQPYLPELRYAKFEASVLRDVLDEFYDHIIIMTAFENKEQIDLSALSILKSHLNPKGHLYYVANRQIFDEMRV